MPYKIGAKGSYGCSGYPALKEGSNEVMGCHKTRAEAAAQIYAINRSEGNIGKAATDLTEGDFAMTGHGDDKFHIGQVVHVMYEGALGNPGTDYYIEASESNPAVMIQLFEQEESGYWKATREYTACAMNMYVKIPPLETEPAKDDMAMKSDDSIWETVGRSDEEPGLGKATPCWDGYVQRGMKPGEGGRMVPNCVPAKKADDLWEDSDDVIYETDDMSKAEGYSPPQGARNAAKRAIRWKEEGKATGAGTSVGWTRAGQLARGETLSLSTVKRMYSYFSRHEVDKKGKDFYNTSNPSNGRIMWDAWGGDAGYTWSRRIAQREADKALFADFGQYINRASRLTEVFKNQPNSKDVPGLYYGEGSFVSGGVGKVKTPPKDVLGNLSETEEE